MSRLSDRCTDDVSRPAGSMVPCSFFARPSDIVAPDLIGKILWREGVGGGRLTEVEAYLPQNDPACHAWRGRTPRNEAMFGPPGTVYVYLSYGVHVLLNLVCDREGVGSAVLIRSFEPVGGMSGLRANRSGAQKQVGDAVPSGQTGFRPARDFCHLSCGPGRVGQALGLELGMDGSPLGDVSGLSVIDDDLVFPVGVTTRIGVSVGDQLRLRYYAIGSSYVTGRARLDERRKT